MKPHVRLALVSSALMLPIAVIVQVLLADPRAIPQPVAGEPPAVPEEASYAHHMRFRVIDVTPVERVDDTQILKLDLERFYGKIDSVSKSRADEHETQRMSILFPATPHADIRPGDLINYRLLDYQPIGRDAPGDDPDPQ